MNVFLYIFALLLIYCACNDCEWLWVLLHQHFPLPGFGLLNIFLMLAKPCVSETWVWLAELKGLIVT